jgi:hypothetical protein
LRLGLCALRGDAAQEQIGIRRVEARDDVTDRNPIALGDRDLEQPAAHFCRDPHFGGFDVAGGAGGGRRRAAIAAGDQNQQREGVLLHAIRPSSCARVSRWMWSTTMSREMPVTRATPARAIF